MSGLYDENGHLLDPTEAEVRTVVHNYCRLQKLATYELVLWSRAVSLCSRVLLFQCISLVRQHFPDANGAEFSNVGGGWCNAVFDAVGVVFDSGVQSCLFEAPLCTCP